MLRGCARGRGFDSLLDMSRRHWADFIALRAGLIDSRRIDVFAGGGHGEDLCGLVGLGDLFAFVEGLSANGLWLGWPVRLPSKLPFYYPGGVASAGVAFVSRIVQFVMIDSHTPARYAKTENSVATLCTQQIL